MRDWFLGLCLVWIVVSCALMFVQFRLAAFVLALCPITIAIMRLSPTGFQHAWSNRTPAYDATVGFLAGFGLIVLAAVVPGG
ncbi:hypothetical protein NQ038_01560 [Brevibacterium sp. 50QC2O2]|jgi:hypothetical protein|uniref:hypothetical protein n=1 Tax=Brevibacterium TaxID=1696 RepID=UPI00211BE003|nr:MULTISPECIES: hypothetical protein [unclassified Brevibacterium]MCQ9369219.1 hypothetical protein [Brevibacterium sp. 91QC2O2]MCQ9386843.1 hypothetical protein [Brevibacterium sp. 68QC2CO]MCQ9387338.1 hypothetical protein [Brevibacterium sp. 50QC2O2]